MTGFNSSRRGVLAGGFAAALGVALSGCSVSKDKAGITTLKIAVVSSFAGQKVRLSGLDYVVDKFGWLREGLEKRGIKLEYFPAPNSAVGPIVNEAFANHQIQFAGYSDLPSIILNASNTTGKTKLVLPGNPSDSYLVVPVGSTARSIEDLKGKRLAIHRGRPWELPLLRLLTSKGLTYDDFQIFNINPDAGAAAVATGGVDGLFTISAFGLEDKGVAKIIWSTADQALDWKSWGGQWVSRTFLSEQPDIAQLVVDSYVRAAHWISDEKNKDEIVLLGTRNGTPEHIVRRTYDQSNISWKDRWSPRFPPELYTHYREASAFAKQNGIITGDVDVDALLDDSLVEKALKTLSLETYWDASKFKAGA
ncbi:ABC transporter substrate-binding protein [Asticcacaulis sp. BYS171W]|uniref:ABC transporter substrate-binding protein n=1 Tax=Asticcacaulis aquaticus TaxID=2984212 RepID=A0ABT5HYN6_9CAUL|nr:PhnD/SsuA/transferrin family substrate-binding protein [Asticcacaulis aquaticus]MDC7685184.1 ABC transporter substrate-binding protein [Asticcacaulis aquaticus]